MDVKSLEQRIIEASDRNLMKELKAAFQPGRDYVSGKLAIPRLFKDAAGKEPGMQAFQVVEFLVEETFKVMRDDRRQKALSAFVEKVDRIQEQLDALMQIGGEQ